MTDDNPMPETDEAAAAAAAKATSKAEKDAARAAKALEASKALLAEFSERYPQVFTADPEAVKPLAIHIHKQLFAAGYNFNMVKRTLALYVSTPAYLAALAAGKPRIGLDGEPAGEVAEEHREFAKARLANPDAVRDSRVAIELIAQVGSPFELKKKKKPMPQIELTAVQAKITFAIDPETFRAALDVDSTGQKSVLVTIAAEGKKYQAHLNAKSFRKAQAAFREAANPVVSISGNLKGGAVESAGIQVFDKDAKAAA